MGTTVGKRTKGFMLRMDPELHSVIKAEAARAGVSLSSYVGQLIQKARGEDVPPEPAPPPPPPAKPRSDAFADAPIVFIPHYEVPPKKGKR